MGEGVKLFSQYDSGRHNEQLKESAERIIRTGSWKKQRVVLVLPSASLIPAKVALSHWNLIFPPNQGVVRILALDSEVGDAYSTAISQVLAHPDLKDWEYLLTIEHDNIPQPDGVIKLIESMERHPEFACIGGLYWTKGEGGVPQIWGDPKDPVVNFRPQAPDYALHQKWEQDPTFLPLQETCGTGMGFNLWRLSMFKDERLRRPWFKTLAGADGVGTQDLYFWGDARKYGYRCAIDLRVKVGHFDYSTGVTW